MKIKSINLPKPQRFPCSKRDAKAVFGDLSNINCDFGRPMLHIPRYKHTSFSGLPLARASLSRQFDVCRVCLFAVRRSEYPEEAAQLFPTAVLPKVRAWLDKQITKPATTVLRSEELFVLWSNREHRFQLESFMDCFN